MANKLVSVDENLHLPTAVRNQLKTDVESDVSESVETAQIAASTASVARNEAVTARNQAVAAAESITIPLDEQIAEYVSGAEGTETQSALDLAYGLVVNVKDQRYGAIGDGSTNDKPALIAALAVGASLGLPITVYFPPGEYNCGATGEISIDREGVTIMGAGETSTTVVLSTGFRLSKGNFTAKSIHFLCPSYSSSNRAIQNVLPLTQNLVGVHVDSCRFTGYFYATDLRGATYEQASNPEYMLTTFVRDVKITNCTSTAPAGNNAGHFQHLACSDVTISGCSTYGGAGATSYNFIGGNGYVRLVGNFDDANTYGSCEIENRSGLTTIVGNTFRRDLWIDDSSNVTITGNIVETTIRLTIQTYDVRRVSVTGNVAGRITITQFGTTQNASAILDNVVVSGNVFHGTTTWGILIQDTTGRIRGVDIIGNTLAGTFSSGAIGLSRNNGMAVRLLWNQLRASNNAVSVSGSGGTVNTVGNTGAVFSGTRDRFPMNFREFQVAEGIVVTSTGNGTPYRIVVSDSGVVSAVAV